MVQEGAFRKLLVDKNLQQQFEQRLDQAENLFKNVKFALYDKDYEILDKSKMQYKVIFDAVEHL